MKWILFTGTWRLVNQYVETDVRKAVRDVVSSGNGIVTGGATGVDYFVMDEYLKLDPDCRKLRIFIPARVDHFICDYHENWCEYPVTHELIDDLHVVLKKIKEANPAAVFEFRKESGEITQEEYSLRHDEEVAFSDEVYAFQVNDSLGTQDTVDKAKAAGLPIVVHKKYTI